MYKVILAYILVGLPMFLKGQSQNLVPSAVSGDAYHHPSGDKVSWQRLNLQLSSTFIVVAKEGQIWHDTCLLTASRSLGMSRFPILAEGIDDPELFGQSQWIDRREPGIGVRLLSKEKGLKHLQLLMLLGSYYTFQPGSYFNYKDSVEYFLNRAVEESKSLKKERLGRIALCLLGKMYIEVNDNKGDSIYNLLINECRKAGDKEIEARAFAYRGIYTAPMQATFQKKTNDLQVSLDLYHSLGNTEAEINLLIDLGYMLVVSGQLQGAHDNFVKALALAETIRFPYTHYITESLAMVSNFQGKFGEPFRYTIQTIRVAESCRDSIGWGYFYARLSNLYNSEGRVHESLSMAQKAAKRFISDHNPVVYTILIEIVTQMCDEGRAAEALNFIGEISNKVDPPATFADMFAYQQISAVCYLYLNKLDLAEMHIQKMDSLETKSEAVRGPLRRTAVSDQLGVIFFQRGQYLKAKEYFERHFTTPSIGQRALLNDLHIYRWLIITDSVLGDNASAVSHYKKYTQLLDSNFKVTKIRQAEELQVMYETKEKEDQIAALNQQSQQTKLLKNLSLAGVAAVVIIAALLYRQNRLKQKGNKLITEKNEQLQHLLDDKEWLLKEIHHRVKNNLQIVMSLLNSQAVYINNDAALTAIHDSKRRVYAISLIHQKLYQDENTSTIAMPGYINELLHHLRESFDTGSRMTFEQHVAPLDLDISQAIPLGLIINECVVNAIKYAFPNGQKGIVRVRFQPDGEEHLLLHLSDNGIGLPENFDTMEHSSLGLELIKGLARQLQGNLNIQSDNGVHITIRFTIMNKQISQEAVLKSFV